MRHRPAVVVALLLGFGIATGPAPCVAEPTPSLVQPAWVEEALVAAKENRPQLEQALTRARALGAAEAAAMEFLVANMPGKGYVVFALKTQQDGKEPKGTVVPFDPLSYPDFKAAKDALDAIEQAHGTVEFERDRFVPDVETLSADFLVRHVEHALRAWRTPPPAHRVSFEVFLRQILPYRGSEEPAQDWLTPCMARYAELPAEVAADPTPTKVLGWVGADVGRRVPFDERWYLHPTDQSFSEMEKSHGGRCEDITNATTFAARARGLAIAQDFTPRWGHRDNNHAWPVLLDAQGRGAAPEQGHAAKVYRKTFEIQRDGLWSRLPKGREAPNRWIEGRACVDVTAQYGPTSDIEIAVDPATAKDERVVYLCVFSGGEWFAMDHALLDLNQGTATFRALGRGGPLGGMLWLPAVHDGKALVPVGPPFLLRADGRVERFAGCESRESLVVTATLPEQQSADTKAVTPPTHLRPGATYRLQRWDGAWTTVKEFVAGPDAPRFDDLSGSRLWWLVEQDGRTEHLERPFSIEDGRQRFW
ncbi:MAG: hypothetical protein IT460_15490 [Planctomycetes bacterium]|nr:hypothetical protein [Planctomycetota bacterium]